jgi:uncharacterized protein (DUF488 family)
MKIYTLGYQGRKLRDIKLLAAHLSATVIDIRYSPTSRNPEYRGAAPIGVLGNQYQWLRKFGNANYKQPGAPIQIVYYDEGRKGLEHMATDIILMCVCRDYTHCHRKVVADLLRRDGFEVEELSSLAPPEPTASQISLF